MRLHDLLDQLRSLDENARLEAKRGSQLGESILQTICAFANEPGLGGGTILLGVIRQDEGLLFPDYLVCGVPEPDKLQNDLVSQCRSVFNVPVSISVTAERSDDRTVLIVDVDEASPAQKPIYFSRKPLPAAAFRRLGSADVKCTEEDLALLYQQRKALPLDASIVEGTTLADCDAEAVALYRTTRARSNPAAEELSFGDADLLKALRCAEETPSGLRLTLAGLLLFGRAMAQRRLLPMVRLDYVRVPGRQWVSGEGERFSSTLDMRGPLLLLLGRAQAAILDDLPRAFHLPEGEMQREDAPSLPTRVIREAVVNALMHRSYRSQRPTQIIRFANRLELRNPGHSLKSPDRLGEPGSEPRNPTIAAVLHELNFAETKGTGIRIMQEEMRRAGLSPPAFVSDREADSFTATFLFHHFLDGTDIAWLGQFKEHALSDEMLKALVYVREQGSINNATYRVLNQCHPADATRDLRRLCELELLLAEGNTASRVYAPGRRLAEAEEAAEGMHDGGANMPDSGSSMPDKAAGMPDKAAGMPDNGLADMPDELSILLGSIGQRSPPAYLRTVIARLCAWQPLSVAQLAGLLKRSERHTREVVGEMVARGQLEHTRAGSPRSPKQAYRAVARAKGP